jgi:ribosomal protein S18 acetylase RimI-like enzyme
MAGWPALEETADGAWRIRLSEGFTGRANSLNVLEPADDAGLERRLAAALALFAARGLPPVVRVTPLTPPALLGRLAAEGWVAYGHSLVMTRRLAAGAAADPPALSPSAAWLDAMAMTMEFSRAKRDAIGRKLAHAGARTGYFLALEEGEPVATTMAALTEGGVGLFEVGVAPAQRRRGSGAAIVGQALAWAAAEGADRAFLQVTASNAPAVALYRRLGFVPIYGYRYMRPPP